MDKDNNQATDMAILELLKTLRIINRQLKLVKSIHLNDQTKKKIDLALKKTELNFHEFRM